MPLEALVPALKALAIAIGGGMPALAVGLIGFAAMQAMGRNPEAADKVFTPMLIGMAFAEAFAIYVLVVIFAP